MTASAVVDLAVAQLAVVVAAVLLRRQCPAELFDARGAPRDLCPASPLPLWAILTIVGLAALWLLKALRAS